MEITNGEALARLIAMGADPAAYNPEVKFWRKSERATHHADRYCTKNRAGTWSLEGIESQFSGIKLKRLCSECGVSDLPYNVRTNIRTVKELLEPLRLLSAIAERSKTEVEIMERGSLFVRSVSAAHNMSQLAGTLSDDLYEVREAFVKESTELLANVRSNLKLEETRQLHERRCRLDLLILKASGPHNTPYLTNEDSGLLDVIGNGERSGRLWWEFTNTVVRDNDVSQAHSNVLRRAKDLATSSVTLTQLTHVSTPTERAAGENLYDYVSRSWKSQVLSAVERLAGKWHADWDNLSLRTRDSIVALHRVDFTQFSSHLSELLTLSTISNRGTNVVVRVNEVTAELIMARTAGSSWRNVATTALLAGDDDATIQTAIALWSPDEAGSSYQGIDVALEAARQL